MSKSIKKSAGMAWAMVTIMLLGTIFVAGGMVGCEQEGLSGDVIVAKATNNLATTAVSTIKAMDAEIAAMDSELNAVETKLLKVEQVAKPALGWIEYMKGKAKQEQWNARILEVTSDLAKFKNDQYQVVKLQFIVEFLTAGWRYSGVIHIDELAMGKVTPYEELRDNLKKQVDDMTYQRETKAKARNLAYSTALGMKDMYQQWKATKIDSVTYRITGVGLGMTQGKTAMGTWNYNTETDKLTPVDEAADNLQEVLLGK
jgi:hypothetical protein